MGCVVHFKKKMGFTPRKAEQQLQGMELQEKHNKIKKYRKSLWKEPTINRYLLILDLKPFRS